MSRHSPTQETTSGTGYYHVLEEPSHHSTPHTMLPVTEADNSPAINVSSDEVPMTVLPKVF